MTVRIMALFAAAVLIALPGCAALFPSWREHMEASARYEELRCAEYARNAVYLMPSYMERFGIEYPPQWSECQRLSAVVHRGHRPIPGFERVMLYDPVTGTTRSAIVRRGTVIDGVAIRRSQVPGARSE